MHTTYTLHLTHESSDYRSEMKKVIQDKSNSF